MNNKLCKAIFSSVILIILSGIKVHAQEYVSPTQPVQLGKAPGMQVRLIDSIENSKTYVIVFKSGDEAASGLATFAENYHIVNAHYTAIGDATSVKAGWYDYSKKQFKVNKIGTSEISSFIGDIAVYNGKATPHTHVNVATEDGVSHGGHLLELYVGPTLEVFVTTHSMPLYKKLDNEFKAAVIDPTKEN